MNTIQICLVLALSSLLLVSAKPGHGEFAYKTTGELIEQPELIDCEQDSVKLATPIISMSPAPIMRSDINLVAATPAPIMRTVEVEPARIYATASVAPPIMEARLAPQPLLKVARPLGVSSQFMQRFDQPSPIMYKTRLEAAPAPIINVNTRYMAATPAPILRTVKIEPARMYATASVAPPLMEARLAPQPLLKVARPLAVSSQSIQRFDEVAPAPAMWQTRMATAPASIDCLEDETPIVQTRFEPLPLIRTTLAKAPMIETKVASTVIHDAPTKILSAPMTYSYGHSAPQYNSAVVVDRPTYYTAAAAIAPQKYITAAAPVAFPKYYAASAPLIPQLPAPQYYSAGPTEYKSQPIIAETVAQEPCEK